MSIEKKVVDKILSEKLSVKIGLVESDDGNVWEIVSVDYPDFVVEDFRDFRDARDFCNDYGLPYEIM